MDATKKNTLVMLAFFVLIMLSAIYYSTVLQKKLQSPISQFETEQPASAGQFANLD